MEFEILIQEFLVDINTEEILGLANDFEDGKWRYDKFQNYIWNNISETALSAEEREKLVNLSQSILIESAKALRIVEKDSSGSGSELAEILLYGIMKDYYSALPVVPKIFYKQNANDNAKGSDSVHIVIENQEFSLWFGEAKFYTDIRSAISKAVNSIHEFLNDNNKIRKENSIITSLSDIDNLERDKELIKKIKVFLDPNSSLDTIKEKLHIPILLLYECEITKESNEFTQQYKDSLIKFFKKTAESYFCKQKKKCSSIFKYDEIKFHLILFPIPNKKDIVDKFTKRAKFYIEE